MSSDLISVLTGLSKIYSVSVSDNKSFISFIPFYIYVGIINYINSIDFSRLLLTNTNNFLLTLLIAIGTKSLPITYYISLANGDSVISD